MIFYDTCALINRLEDISSTDYTFCISSVTLDELEKIKLSKDKDEEIKYKVRKLLYWMYLNQDRYIVTPHCEDYKNADDAIIEDASSIKDETVTFFTSDLSCYHRAKTKLRYVEYISDMKQDDKYTGYKKFAPMSTEDENDLYEKIYQNVNFANLLENEYLIVNCGNGKKDYFKWRDNKFEKVPFRTVESMHFGIFKPRNDEQVLALDSMFTNRVTLLGGPAGSGKSAASLAYLFNQLENGKIDRIIVFCNPVAAKNAAKLG